ncbi:MAG: hypothetical protein IPL96_13545 [Holophagaceae bacterium]|nr:hypothetical protein [Holophagaceae bacterium]
MATELTRPSPSCSTPASGGAGHPRPGRAANLRQLFSQGYQGPAIAFGYPACPTWKATHHPELLGGPSIGVELTESFQDDPEYTTSALWPGIHKPDISAV